MVNEAYNQKITRNLLQYCYTCQEAHACDAMEKCQACWEAHGMLNDPDERNERKPLTTEELLFLYAL
ncbi:hypothetical protein FHS18_005825 [Paenibacillus phyllosphaerae]|uniref:Uncharacterized protein n=1 Tax=Paenibacillus phyllosphaerae TaxID=274593 RepID=A0A7W5FQX9_9BACL|nr:hypothetical protein [Paenibacillus phyllosphaerae]